jgi:hypothetical protein
LGSCCPTIERHPRFFRALRILQLGLTESHRVATANVLTGLARGQINVATVFFYRFPGHDAVCRFDGGCCDTAGTIRGK